MSTPIPTSESTGMRDLRANISAYVQMVARGEDVVVITLSGLPVAALVPVDRCGRPTLPKAMPRESRDGDVGLRYDFTVPDKENA